MEIVNGVCVKCNICLIKSALQCLPLENNSYFLFDYLKNQIHYVRNIYSDPLSIHNMPFQLVSELVIWLYMSIPLKVSM